MILLLSFLRVLAFNGGIILGRKSVPDFPVNDKFSRDTERENERKRMQKRRENKKKDKKRDYYDDEYDDE